MKIIGRRWAKIQDVTQPGYVPTLRNGTPSQMSEEQLMSQQPVQYAMQNMNTGVQQQQQPQQQYQQQYTPTQQQQAQSFTEQQNINAGVQNTAPVYNAQPQYTPQYVQPQAQYQQPQYTQPQNGRTGYTHEYLLDNGQIINTTQAYDMAKRGEIEGVMCSSNKGTKYIRMVGDGNMYNNLDDLPEF